MRPYKNLSLKPAPDTARGDVRTMEMGRCGGVHRFRFSQHQALQGIRVSPQNEWVDLDINLSAPRHEDGWLWNSGFEHSARIDRSAHIWYAAMRIPLAALGTPAAAEGTAFE